MALSQELEDVISELAKVDAAGAAEFRATVEKHPTLHKPLAGFGMRQADYDRRMNEVKTDLDGAKAIRTWYDGPTGKVAYDRTLSERDTAIAKQKELEAEVARRAVAIAAIENAKGKDGAPVDAAVLAENIMKQLEGRIVGKTELTEIATAESRKIVNDLFAEARDKFYKNDFASSAQWITSLVEVQQDHFQDTGKKLDRKAFATFMKENNFEDPTKAYEQYVAPAKREKDIEAEAEKRANEIIAKRTEAGGFPGSSGSPGSGGHLQVRLLKKEAGDPLFGSDAQLGDNSLAVAAAAELNSEGK